MDTRKTILECLYRVDPVHRERERIDDSMTLAEDLGMDSYDIVEFLMEIEVKFNIDLDPDEGGVGTTFGEVVAAVEKAKK